MAHPGIVPGTLTVAWPASQSLSDNGAGLLTGASGSGTVKYTEGVITIRPAILPPGGVVFTLGYQYGDPLTATFAAPARLPDGSLSLTLPHSDIAPNTLGLEFPVDIPGGRVTMVVTDDGAGVLPLAVKGGTDGSINYATGAIAFMPDVVISQPKVITRQAALGST